MKKKHLILIPASNVTKMFACDLNGRSHEKYDITKTQLAESQKLNGSQTTTHGLFRS